MRRLLKFALILWGVLVVTMLPALVNPTWLPKVQTFDGVAMVFVPRGCFRMGLSVSEIASLDKQYGAGYFDASGPPSPVCVNSFWMDKYLVTNTQFTQFNGKAAYPSYWTGVQRPRDSITWF